MLAGQIGVDQFDILDGSDQRLAFDPNVVPAKAGTHAPCRRRCGGVSILAGPTPGSCLAWYVDYPTFFSVQASMIIPGDCLMLISITFSVGYS
jgi:hypothetical protein